MFHADVEKTQAPADQDFYRNRMNEKLRQEQENYAFQNQCGVAGRAMSDEEILAEFFKYHPPTVDAIPKYAAINQRPRRTSLKWFCRTARAVQTGAQSLPAFAMRGCSPTPPSR